MATSVRKIPRDTKRFYQDSARLDASAIEDPRKLTVAETTRILKAKQQDALSLFLKGDPEQDGSVVFRKAQTQEFLDLYEKAFREVLRETTKSIEKFEASPRVISILIYCPVKKVELFVPISKCHFSGSEQECGSCGSHGGVDVHATCLCGKLHDIELERY